MLQWTLDFLKRRGWRTSQWMPGRIFAEMTGRDCPCILLEIYNRRSTGTDEYALHYAHGILIIRP